MSTTPAPLHLEVADLPVVLRFAPAAEPDRGTAAIAAQLAELWEPLVTRSPRDPAPAGITLRVGITGETGDDADGADTIQLPPEHADSSYIVSGRVTQALIEHFIGERLLLHAGAVDLPGVGIVMVTGASGAGKSTATTVLAASGGYITDELTILDPRSLQIDAYPKPLSHVYTIDGARIGKRDFTMAEVGIDRVLTGRVGAPSVFLLVNRDQDADGVTFETMRLLEAIAVISGQSSSIWLIPNPLGTLVRLLQQTGGLLRATYAESADLPAALAEHLRGPDDAPAGAPTGASFECDIVDPPAHLRPAEAPDPSVLGSDSAAGTAGAPLRLLPFHQAVWTADGCVVLTGGDAPTAVVLEGLSALLWSLLLEADEDADAPADLTEADLLALLRAEIGDHPDSETVLTEVLALLRSHALLV